MCIFQQEKHWEVNHWFPLVPWVVDNRYLIDRSLHVVSSCHQEPGPDSSFLPRRLQLAVSALSRVWTHPEVSELWVFVITACMAWAALSKYTHYSLSNARIRNGEISYFLFLLHRSILNKSLPPPHSKYYELIIVASSSKVNWNKMGVGTCCICLLTSTWKASCCTCLSYKSYRQEASQKEMWQRSLSINLVEYTMKSQVFRVQHVKPWASMDYHFQFHIHAHFLYYPVSSQSRFDGMWEFWKIQIKNQTGINHPEPEL